jgi:hypothetical protein
MAKAPISYRNASLVTQRPVVPGPIINPVYPQALTSGSQLNRAAVGGPSIKPPLNRHGLSSGSQIDVAMDGAPWPLTTRSEMEQLANYESGGPLPPRLIEGAAHNTPASYGLVGSLPFWGKKANVYGVGAPDTNGQGSIGLYPGPVPSGLRPMWNNLVAITWGLRVVNPVANGSQDSTIQGTVSQGILTNPVQFVPAGTASLSIKGENIV